MIFDKVENISLYRGMHAGIDQAIDLIKSNHFDEAELGKTVIDGDNLFYLVQAYETKSASETKLETHNRYIDIQFMVKGDEMMGFANKSELTVLTEYDDTSDIQFFEGKYLPLLVKEGYFAIFFPNDAHKPGNSVESPKQVKKIVFKIAVN